MRRLTDAELAAYDHIPPAVAARVRIVKVRFLAPGADGMTLGRFVLLTRDDPADRTGARELVAHELVHVVQYREMGTPRFLWRYVTAYVRNLRRLRSHRQAYLAIPVEEAARDAAAHWARSRS